MRALLPVLLLATFTLAGCSDDAGDSGDADDTDQDDQTMPTGNQTPMMPAPMTHTVMLQNNQFAPADLTIHVGDTVTWHTMDPQAHNVVSTTPGHEFRSPDISSVTIPTVRSDTYERTFTKAGEIDYVCEYHLPGMVGTLTVLAANVTA